VEQTNERGKDRNKTQRKNIEIKRTNKRKKGKMEIKHKRKTRK
jgi:hypothetical protein